MASLATLLDLALMACGFILATTGYARVDWLTFVLGLGILVIFSLDLQRRIGKASKQ